MFRQIEENAGLVSVTLGGRLQKEDAQLLRQDLLEYMDRGCSNYRIDMSKLEYIDSSGLGVLLALHKITARDGGNLVLAGMRGTVDELFEVTRLKKIFRTEL